METPLIYWALLPLIFIASLFAFCVVALSGRPREAYAVVVDKEDDPEFVLLASKADELGPAGSIAKRSPGGTCVKTVENAARAP